MEYKKCKTEFIDVIERDVTEDGTLITYKDSKGNCRTVNITNKDYGILRGQKILIGHIDENVLGYCKNKKDAINYTKFLKDEINKHKINPELSYFIISTKEEKRKLVIHRNINPLSWTLAFPITILLFILISGFIDANILANSAMAIPIITFLIGVFTIIGYEISIEIKGNIADKFSNKYIDFIVDEFEQKLTNERHNFNE
jgi:hypothetical protein